MNAGWSDIFDAVAEELCGVLQTRDLLSRLSHKEVETPDGLADYETVLTVFATSEDYGRRNLARHLLRIITQERLTLGRALDAIDIGDMWRA